MIDSSLWGKKKSRPLGFCGTSAMGCLVFILIAAVVGFVGFKIGEAYWSFFEVRHKTLEALNWAIAGAPKADAEIRQKVIANAAEVGVGLSPQNIQVLHTTDTLTIIVSWSHPVELSQFTFPLSFTTNQTGEKRWYKGPLILKDKP